MANEIGILVPLKYDWMEKTVELLQDGLEPSERSCWKNMANKSTPVDNVYLRRSAFFVKNKLRICAFCLVSAY